MFSSVRNPPNSTDCAVPHPGGRAVQFAGTARANRDTVHGIVSRLPLVLGLIAIITLVLLFPADRRCGAAVKSLALNVCPTARSGRSSGSSRTVTWAEFGTTATGTLVANMPVLLFCIAFGLSMDYEVFLISRIREFWLGFGDDGSPAAADNDESVALGVAHTARVITAAALIMAITFAALAAAQLSALRLFGVGLTVARARRRNPGAVGAGARLHARDGQVELVGAKAVGAPAPTAGNHRRLTTAASRLSCRSSSAPASRRTRSRPPLASFDPNTGIMILAWFFHWSSGDQPAPR